MPEKQPTEGIFMRLTDEDDVEGHTTLLPKAVEDDVEGHATVLPKAVEDDVEGHTTLLPKAVEDDVEGHSFKYHGPTSRGE